MYISVCSGVVRHRALGHVPLWNTQILQPFKLWLCLSSAQFSQLEVRPSKSPVTVAGCCKETSAIFVFVDLTPDGFHFWMTLSPRTSEPVRHAPRDRAPPGAKFWRRQCLSAVFLLPYTRRDAYRQFRRPWCKLQTPLRALAGPEGQGGHDPKRSMIFLYCKNRFQIP